MIVEHTEYFFIQEVCLCWHCFKFELIFAFAVILIPSPFIYFLVLIGRFISFCFTYYSHVNYSNGFTRLFVFNRNLLFTINHPVLIYTFYFFIFFQ